MKEHPILFSSEMVRAILDGRKTQDRRVIKPQPDSYILPPVTGLWFGNEFHWPTCNAQYPQQIYKCPYGQPGDRLWVRETWGIFQEDWSDLGWEPEGIVHQEIPKNKNGLINDRNTKQYLVYKSTFGSDENDFWRPSIHMPRWASRITLEITNIRVERVQEISEDDAIAEGLFCYHENYECALDNYPKLWDSINSKRGYGWDTNPYVWVIEFRKVK